MGVSKVILNNSTLIDVTQKTVMSSNLLSPNTALNAAGSDVVGAIATKTAANLSASGSVVTVSSGYYAANVSKAISGGTATTPAKTINVTPTISINSSTGVISVSAASNSSITPTISAGYISAGTAGTVSVSGTNTSQLSTQAAATITPTESEQTAVAAGKYTTGAVKVAAIDSGYVGSNVPQRTSANLSASGSVVTAPAGYYASVAQKSVAAGTATTPAKTINVTPTVSLNSSTGAISIGITGSSNITPTVTAGYISNGTAGTVSVSGSSTFNLATKTAASYTPSSTTQTIASGQYLTGVQTIAGDSNLVAANIASGVTVFGITGTYTGETYVAMTTQEIWEAAASGWGSTNPSVAAAIWNSVAAGWSISATMTDSTIHTSVASGWR